MSAVARTIEPAVAQMASDMTMLVLQPRRVHLKGRAPKAKYVRSLVTRIKAHIVEPALHLLTVSMADLRDGAPLSAVVRPYQMAIDLLVAEANKRDRGLPAMPDLLDRVMKFEMRHQYTLDGAQREVDKNPDSIEALDRCEAAAAAYTDALMEMRAVIRQRRAALRLAQLEAVRA